MTYSSVTLQGANKKHLALIVDGNDLERLESRRWHRSAGCYSTDPALFVCARSEVNPRGAEACRQCQVSPQCLTEALIHSSDGTRAGTSEVERIALHRQWVRRHKELSLPVPGKSVPASQILCPSTGEWPILSFLYQARGTRITSQNGAVAELAQQLELSTVGISHRLKSLREKGLLAQDKFGVGSTATVIELTHEGMITVEEDPRFFNLGVSRPKSRRRKR